MVWIFQLQSQSHASVVYASLVIAALPTFAVFVCCQRVIMRGIIHDGQAAWVRQTNHLGTVEQAEKRLFELAQEHPGIPFRVMRLWPGQETVEVTKMVTQTVADTPLGDELSDMREDHTSDSETTPASVPPSSEILTAPTRDDHDSDDAHASEEGLDSLF